MRARSNPTSYQMRVIHLLNLLLSLLAALLFGACRPLQAPRPVARVGVAFQRALAERLPLAMLGPAKEHESIYGTYLAANVVYLTLFEMKQLLIPLIFTLACPALRASDARIAFLGDSITYDGRWPALVESALRATPQFADADIVNFGLPSETVSGLSEAGHAGGEFPRPCLHERLERVLAAFEPTLVLACYGMNDGIYLPPEQTRFKAFQNGILELKSAVEKHGARIIFITPPLYQPGKSLDDGNRYDAVLDGYADWLVSRRATGWQVVDIRPAVKQAVAQAQAADPAFAYAGDGVHPGDEGHRFIATAVCKQLWPLLDLPGSARFAEDPALQILGQRQDLLKQAWLSKTRHVRPGIPAGLPLDQAREKAAPLLAEYRAAMVRAGAAVPVKTSQWSGYERLDFAVDGRAALVVRPKSPAPGNPWIWRTEFFGHEPQADIALLGRGFHVAYIDVQNLYGAPVALQTHGTVLCPCDPHLRALAQAGA